MMGPTQHATWEGAMPPNGWSDHACGTCGGSTWPPAWPFTERLVRSRSRTSRDSNWATVTCQDPACGGVAVVIYYGTVRSVAVRPPNSLLTYARASRRMRPGRLPWSG